MNQKTRNNSRIFFVVSLLGALLLTGCPEKKSPPPMPYRYLDRQYGAHINLPKRSVTAILWE